MEELLKLIYAKLITSGYNAFEQGKVKKGTDLPYVTYNLSTGTPTNENFQLEDYILEVDVWDEGSDSLVVEEMTDKISLLLNRAVFYKEDILQAKAYLLNRLRIEDEREEFNRRQLRFQLRTYMLIDSKEEIL